MALPKKGVAYDFYITLIDNADPSKFKVNPTLATGDFKVSKDGGAFVDLDTLPVVAPAGGRVVKVSLSATEMGADNWAVQGVDVAGDEWQEVIYTIEDHTETSLLIEELYELRGFKAGVPMRAKIVDSTPGYVKTSNIEIQITRDGDDIVATRQ